MAGMEADPVGTIFGSEETVVGPRVQVTLPRQYVRPCLLVLLAEAASHGYELLEQVRDLGVGNVDAGGLYRELRAMEREGLVRSWWEESPAGPARRTYTPTQTGLVALVGVGHALRDLHQILGDLVARHEDLCPVDHRRPLL